MRRRQPFKFGFTGGLFLPSPLLFQVAERGTSSNSKYPWSKEAGLFEPSEFSSHQDEDFLQDVICVGRPDQAEHVSAYRRLNTAEQQFERIAVAGLGA